MRSRCSGSQRRRDFGAIEADGPDSRTGGLPDCEGQAQLGLGSPRLLRPSAYGLVQPPSQLPCARAKLFETPALLLRQEAELRHEEDGIGAFAQGSDRDRKS